MDIEHAPIPFCDKFRGQYPHISSQYDISRARLGNCFVHDGVMGSAFKADMRFCKNRNALHRCDF